MVVVGDQTQTGVFYGNSKVSYADILDGSTNTLLIGERSSSLFHSTWTGVVEGADKKHWRVVGWTSEPPNFRPTVSPQIQFQPVAQFNSVHEGGITMFAFADGSVRSLDSSVDWNIFHAMGTINGRE